MIKNWKEIQERYDNIKDHKPKANKKLAELGEIISSAFYYDPSVAKEMWEYIINLNVVDDATEEFYICKIAKKLCMEMNCKDLEKIINMTPSREESLYKFEVNWVLRDMFSGCILNKNLDSAIKYANYILDYNKNNNLELNKALSKIIYQCSDIAILSAEYKVLVDSFIEKLKDEKCERIVEKIECLIIISGLGNGYDYKRWFIYTKNQKEWLWYFQLLWVAKDAFSQEELIELWEEYSDSDEDIVMSQNLETDSLYEESQIQFYAELEEKSDVLLKRYFLKENDFELDKAIIWNLLKNEKWDIFCDSLAYALNTCDDFQRIEYVLKDFLTVKSDCIFDEFGRDLYLPTEGHSDIFLKSLENAIHKAKNSEFIDEYIKLVNEYAEETKRDFEKEKEKNKRHRAQDMTELVSVIVEKASNRINNKYPDKESYNAHLEEKKRENNLNQENCANQESEDNSQDNDSKVEIQENLEMYFETLKLQGIEFCENIDQRQALVKNDILNLLQKEEDALLCNILDLLRKNCDILRPVKFSEWISLVLCNADGIKLLNMFRNNSQIFATWMADSPSFRQLHSFVEKYTCNCSLGELDALEIMLDENKIYDGIIRRYIKKQKEMISKDVERVKIDMLKNATKEAISQVIDKINEEYS